MKRIAVLASGGGTNLQAMLDHFDSCGTPAGEVVVVASDRQSAGALERARVHHIPTAIVQARSSAAGQPLDDILDEHRIDMIALAGYLRLVPERTVDRYRGRIVNIHPFSRPLAARECTDRGCIRRYSIRAPRSPARPRISSITRTIGVR